MNDKNNLYKYAYLVLTVGVNLQPEQGLELICPVEKRDVAKAFTTAAYDLGAKIVHVRWEDEIIEELNYRNAELSALCEVPDWVISQRKYLLDKGFCYVAIAAEDPDAFRRVPAEKLSAVAIARSKALKKFSDAVMANAIRWCVVSVPTKKWAKKVFPQEKYPERRLQREIEKAMRLDCADPIEKWQEHIAEMEKHAAFMNEQDFYALHYVNGSGTDVTVGLADGHEWLSAQEKAKDGVDFVANIPTEEIFTAPHRKRINGTVKASMPLSYNGQVIKDISLTFKNGKITGFSASEGYGVLKGLIETDEGTKSLGEVALIGKSTPIAQSGIIFFNTLFDENASCHLAIGKAYPTTVKNGADMSAKELKAHGLNDSVEHVDFMIGTDDLIIDGVKKDGKTVRIFENGDWVI